MEFQTLTAVNFNRSANKMSRLEIRVADQPDAAKNLPTKVQLVVADVVEYKPDSNILELANEDVVMVGYLAEVQNMMEIHLRIIQRGIVQGVRA